ncbi:MAG: CSLREA domain-containing protein [Deltaproteobacteria bacterium]|nr:CSLREA domain-containing protein [Deltaproteobacteria bacterium]
MARALCGGGFTVAAVAAVLLVSTAAAHASTITVTSTADDYDHGPNGNCTLREAVIAANTNTKTDKCPAGGGADTIVIPAGTYTLTIPGTGDDAAHTGDLDITASVTIVGAGADATIVDAGQLDQGFDVLATSGTTSISSLTVRNAWTAFVSRGSKLRLASVSIRAGGGGIRVDGGAVTVTGSTVGDPSGELVSDCANRAELGGGIYLGSGSLVVVDSVVAGNCAAEILGVGAGGGIAVWGGTALLERTVVRGNTAVGDPRVGDGRGGGLFVAGGTLAIRASRVTANLAGGVGGFNAGGLAIVGAGVVTIERSLFDSNVAGAIDAAANGADVPSVAISDSTISGRRAEDQVSEWPLGAVVAISASGPVSITGSTLDVEDGALDGGAVLAGAGPFTLTGTVLDDGCSPTAVVASGGFNLAKDVDCGLSAASDLVGVDPHLAPLGFYGGSTPTRPPLPGSPAIDSGDPNGCTATDQRGFARPADGDLDGAARCDRGALEVACSGIDGQSDECVPLACGAIPRSPRAAAAMVVPLFVVSAAIQGRRVVLRRGA